MPIKLIVLDVDGVLTDGSILINDDGIETKRFHVRDGFAIKAAMSLGIKVGVITGRTTRAVNLRMTELGVDLVMQGIADKGQAFESLCAMAGVLPEDAAFVGDDLVDLPAMLKCGYPLAVADAPEEVQGVANYITQAKGGHAAVREAIEHLLRREDRWDEIVEQYGI